MLRWRVNKASILALLISTRSTAALEFEVSSITSDSPLHGVTETELRERDAEFLVLVNAIDDTSSQPIHARSSYKWQEIVWHAQFNDMYRTTKDGHVTVDLRRLHDIEQTQTRRQRQTLWGF